MKTERTSIPYEGYPIDPGRHRMLWLRKAEDMPSDESKLIHNDRLPDMLDIGKDNAAD